MPKVQDQGIALVNKFSTAVEGQVDNLTQLETSEIHQNSLVKIPRNCDDWTEFALAKINNLIEPQTKHADILW